MPTPGGTLPDVLTLRRSSPAPGRTRACPGVPAMLLRALPAPACVALVLAAAARVTPAAPAGLLVVYAGAGFRLPIEAAAERFRHVAPAELSFAGSGCLLAQAELSGKGDVFIPGELLYIEQARARGLAGPPVPIAILRPVIAVARSNPLGIRGLADLARRGVRVGLGDPQSVAVGIVAERLLAARRDRAAILANVRTRALNVNEIGSQIALGALDAGIVWDATVPLFSGKLEAVTPPGMAGERSVVAGAVLATAANRGAAEAFLAFLASEEGAAIFRRFGYLPYRDSSPSETGATARAAPGSRP